MRRRTVRMRVAGTTGMDITEGTPERKRKGMRENPGKRNMEKIEDGNETHRGN